MLFRSPVDRAAFPKSSVHEQSMNKKVSLFVQGIRLRRSHVPQKPCERGVISKVCVPKAILEQKRAVICSRNTVTQILYASEALWTGCHFGNWNIGTKYGHFVFHEFFNWVGKRLCGKADTYGIHGLRSCFEMFQLIFYKIFPAEKSVSFQSQWSPIAPSNNRIFISKIFHKIFNRTFQNSF
ncbi:MAG: hypothetical protein MJY96_06095 [Bacteroidaceae bacterium]|nr:hypothetical protein [Bacteroidaceae bacterium]